MDDFGSTNGRQVSIALIRDNNFVRTGPLESRGASRGAAVGNLHVANIEVVVCEHRAPDRADENRLVLQAQFVDRFCD